MTKLKKPIFIITIIVLLIVIFIAVFNTLSSPFEDKSIKLPEDRIKTIKSVEKISDYDGLNIYTIDVKFDYDIDQLTLDGPVDTQMLMENMIKVAAPGVDIDYTSPDYGCSVFTMNRTDGGLSFGRNYDFKYDTSAMIVRCHPKDGYASIGTAAISNLYVNDPLGSDNEKIACLASPFICLDGINEKGVGIGVLTLDSDPTDQDTGKKKLATTILIRLVLDKAASTEEAIQLISEYDSYATSGRDYHFYITDETGDSRIVEFDCEDPGRSMVVTPTRSATNFYIKYKDLVLPNQRNGVYGHGRERYDVIEEILTANEGNSTSETAWEALKAASQEPNPESVTSNTQWSIEYDLTGRKEKFVLHRKWDDMYEFELKK